MPGRAVRPPARSVAGNPARGLRPAAGGRKLPAMSPHEPKTRPALFVTCLADALLPEVAAATGRVLAGVGPKPHTPPRQVCCGQSLFKAGHTDAARRVGAAWVRAFAGVDGPIVSPSGSCVAHVRNHLPGLLEPWPRLAQTARELAGRTYELSQYLYRVLGLRSLSAPPPAGPYTYHPSCGLHRALGEDEAPYLLLDSLGGERLPLPDAEVCCGFGGTFSVSHPGVSTSMMADKLAAARSVGARTLVVGDVGCFMHLSCGAGSLAPGLKVVHLSQALAGETA